MRTITTAILTGSALLLFTACGGGGSSSSGGSAPVVDYSGNYDIFVRPSTAYANNGSVCLGAEGIININNSTVTGTVVSDWGDAFNINGNVASSGYIAGGFAVADYSVATWDGQMNTNGGNGIWEDVYGCSGEWMASRK